MAYATTLELATALRIRETPANTALLQSCLDAATAEIDHEIDAVAPEVGAAAFLFDTATAAADPGAGNLRLDKTNPPAVANIYVSGTDADGVVFPGELITGDLVLLSDPADPARWLRFRLTAVRVDNAGWFALPVDYIDQSATALALVAGERLAVVFARPNVPRGDKLALANRVNIVRGVEWYKANDAAFGVIGFDQAGVLQAPRDSFNRHAYELTPLKQQWGLA